MGGIWQTVAGVLAGILLILVFYLAKNALKAPLRACGAGLTVIISARDSAELEQTVKGLITLRRERILDANIVIKTKGHDEEFIRMAGILAGKYDGILVR